MPKLCFSIGEAAHALRICDKGVRRLIKEKKLAAQLVGGVWRIPRAALCNQLSCDPASKCAVSGNRECQLSKAVQA